MGFLFSFSHSSEAGFDNSAELERKSPQNSQLSENCFIFGQTVEDLLRHLTDIFKEEIPAEKNSATEFSNA